MDLLRAEGTNKAIIMSMSFSMAAKLFNFAQSLVVSYAFGTQTSTDILFYMLSTVILLSTLMSSVNQQVIVPNVIYLRTNHSEKDSGRFISYIYTVYLVLGVIATTALFLWPEGILRIFSRFRPEDILANMDIIRYIIPTFLLIVANVFILDMFTSYRYFTLPMLLDMLKNIIIIAFVLVFKDVFSVSSLAMGILFGNLLQFIVLNFMLIFMLKCRPTIKRYSIQRHIKRNIMYVIAGHLSTFLSNFAVIYLMSGFSEGVYSALDYGQKINTVFSLVIIGQITTVVGMNIIELYAKGNHKKLNETFLTYLKMSLFAIIPFSLIISLNSEVIVSLLFERGRFTRESVMLTSSFLRLFVLTLPYLLINGFIVRLIIAKQIQRIAFWWQTLQSTGNIIVIWAMTGVLGYIGYPAGVIAASYIYIFLLMYFLLRHQFDYINNMEAIRFFAFNALLGIGTAAAFYALGLRASVDADLVDKLGTLVWSSALFIAVYLAVGYASGINRSVIKDMLSFVRRRSRKGIGGTAGEKSKEKVSKAVRE